MSKVRVAVSAALGAVVGFVSGVLLAPKSGKETRDELLKNAEKAKDKVVNEAAKVKKTAVGKATEVKNKAEEVVGDVADKAAEITKRAEQAVEGAKKGYNKKPVAKKTTTPKKK